jgi:aminopeptidase N
MKMKWFWCISLVLLASCSVSPSDPPAELVLDIEEPSEDYYLDSTFDWEDYNEGDFEEYVEPSYNPSRQRFVDLIHTKIEANLNWEDSQLNGIATISMTPHFYTIDSVVLDAKGMEIKSVTQAGKALSYDYSDGNVLIVYLGKSYKKDELITLTIDYIAKPEERETSGSAAITSDKGLYFINPTGEEEGKMPQVWTQGETEANSVWFPTIDAPNMKSSQELLLTVDNKYTTLSNGKLISSKKNADGTRTDYWKQDLPHAPYLFMLAVGEFKVVKDSYTRGDGKKIEVNYYVEAEYEKDARAIFGKTPKMIKFFSNKLGVEYPWDKYSEIVVRDYVSGAMENTGAVIFGDYVYKTKRELIDGNDESTIAHELFHHWFGDLVTCESWANLPLNESFANYSQYLWDEYEYGIDEADYNAIEEANGYYQSYGYHDLINFYYDDKEEMFDGHSYNKGGRILHMLRNHLGDDAFFQGLNKYLTTNAYKSAEVHNLRLAMEEVSGEDLNWFFNQWFLGKGHPVIFTEQEINQVQQTVTLRVQQAQSFDVFRLPVKIALWDEAGKHSYSVVLDSTNQQFTFPFKGKIANVLLDEEQMLLAKVYEEKPTAQYIHQFNNAEKFRAKSTALKHIAKSTDPEKTNVLVNALNAKFWGIRAEALNYLKDVEDAAKQPSYKTSLKKIIESDPKSKVRNAAVSAISTLEDNEAITIIRRVLKQDSSLMVLGNALNELKEIDTVQALTLARELSSAEEIELQVGAAEIMGEYGHSSDLTFIETLIKSAKVKDYNKLRTLLAYAYFVIRKGSDAMVNSEDLLSYVKSNGNQYTGWYYDLIVERFMAILGEESEQITAEIETLNPQKDNATIQVLSNKKTKLEDLYNRLSVFVETEAIEEK